jgi:hypothetical protein
VNAPLPWRDAHSGRSALPGCRGDRGLSTPITSERMQRMMGRTAWPYGDGAPPTVPGAKSLDPGRTGRRWSLAKVTNVPGAWGCPRRPIRPTRDQGVHPAERSKGCDSTRRTHPGPRRKKQKQSERGREGLANRPGHLRRRQAGCRAGQRRKVASRANSARVDGRATRLLSGRCLVRRHFYRPNSRRS